MRRIVGWLCLASFMCALVFAGYYAYGVMAPFFQGGEVRYYGDRYTDDAVRFAEQLWKSGVNESAAPLLRGFVTGVKPTAVGRSWDALPQLVETWDTLTTSSDSATDIAWAAVADKDGRVVASYPKELAKSFGRVRSRTAAAGWYGAMGKRLPGVVHVFSISKPGMSSPSGSLAISWRPTARVAVIPYESIVFLRSSTLSLFDVILLSGCSLLLCAILLPFWVAMDADWRGMRGGAWAVLVVVTGMIGFAAYLIARLAPPKQCPNCGEMVQSGYRRCPACGVSLLAKCPKCGRKLKPGWQYCPRCTAEQHEEPAQPEYPQPAEPAEPIRVSAQPQIDDALPSVSRYALEVVVRDAATGAPIVDATVSIVGATTVEGRTGKEGRFEAKALLSDTYAVSVSARGYEPAESRAEVGRDERFSLQLALKARTGTICGRVLDRVSLQPVPGARVFLDSARLERSAISDQDGVFALTDIPPGPYTVCVEADAYARQTRLAEVDPGRPVTVGFALEVEHGSEAKENADAVQ